MAQGVHQSLTWYERTATRPSHRLPLQGRKSADVCVIGAGLAGLTTTLELVRAGKTVVLLEANQVAWAASGRNGGFVSNGFAESILNVQASIGLPAAQALYGLSRQGTDYVRNEIAANDPTLKMGDGWRVALRHPDQGDLKTFRDLMERDYGEVLHYHSVEETRAELNSPRYFQSIANAQAFHFHPLRYALHLAAAAELRGALICEMSPATSTARSGAGWRVNTAQGEVEAEHVVHCVSSLDRKIHKASGRAVLPVATYVAVTEPLTQDAIRTPSAIADTRRAGDYYRLIDEGRILWGGRITTQVREPRHLALRMRQDMTSTYPQLGEPRIDFAWSGLMGYALHKMPLIGRCAEGQWYATAFGGHGMNTTAMAGLVLARAIAGGDDEYRRFEVFGPRWVGGQLGRLGVQGSYWLMQLRDRLDEARAG
jgi:gamma-glutamylputrescine oxidase